MARRKRAIGGNPQLGVFLRTARRERRLTQEQVQARLGVSLAHLRRMEGGKVANPGPELIGHLSEILGRPVDDFYAAAGWVRFDGRQFMAELSEGDRALVLQLVQRLAANGQEGRASAV